MPYPHQALIIYLLFQCHKSTSASKSLVIPRSSITLHCSPFVNSSHFITSTKTVLISRKILTQIKFLAIMNLCKTRKPLCYAKNQVVSDSGRGSSRPLKVGLEKPDFFSFFVVFAQAQKRQKPRVALLLLGERFSEIYIVTIPH